MSGSEIDAIAAGWAARIEARALSEAEQSGLDAWLGADPRHEGALVRARAIWLALDRGRALAAPAVQVEEAPREVHSRRWLMGGLASAAAAGLAAVFLGRPTAKQPRQRFATGKREIRTLALSDGSRTVMNAGSAVSFAFDGRQRLVLLDHGQGWFDVAKDRERPFIVRVGGVEARAVGTAFAVARTALSVDVTVTEGLVEVAGPNGAVQVAAGGRASVPFDGEMMVSAVEPTTLDRELAWRQRRVILDGETLGEAVEEFNRFNDLKIVIEDQALAREPVVGSFDLFAPDQFADAVSTAFSASVRRQGDALLLTAGHNA